MMEFKSWSDDNKKVNVLHFLTFEEYMQLNLLAKTYHSGFGYDLGEHIVGKNDILRKYDDDIIEEILSLSDNNEEDEKVKDKNVDGSDDEGGDLKEESDDEINSNDTESSDDGNNIPDDDGEESENSEDDSGDVESDNSKDQSDESDNSEDESEESEQMVIINLEDAKNAGKTHLLGHKTIVIRLNVKEYGSNWTTKPKKVKKTFFRDKEAKIAKFWYNLPKDKFESELRGQVEFVGPLSVRKYIHVIDTFEEIELRSDEKGSQLTIDDVLFACRGLCSDDTRSVDSFNVLSDNGSTLILKVNIDNSSS